MNEREAVLAAAQRMDWQQVVLNGGPPCFCLEGGCFCGRAQRWEGHGSMHEFVSLHDLLASLAASTEQEGTNDVRDAH